MNALLRQSLVVVLKMNGTAVVTIMSIPVRVHLPILDQLLVDRHEYI